jgi:transposase
MGLHSERTVQATRNTKAKSQHKGDLFAPVKRQTQRMEDEGEEFWRDEGLSWDREQTDRCGPLGKTSA